MTEETLKIWNQLTYLTLLWEITLLDSNLTTRIVTKVLCYKLELSIKRQTSLYWQSKRIFAWMAGLLAIKPELAKECKCWWKFDSLDWDDLLIFQPQFAEKCDKWDEIDADVWHELLAEQPQFEDKCDEYGGWRKFETNHWSLLLDQQPQFKDKRDALIWITQNRIHGFGGLLNLKNYWSKN